MQTLSRHVSGFAMLGGTIVLWIGSSAALQSRFGMGESFQKPVFVTLLNSATSALLLLPRLLRCCSAPRKHDRRREAGREGGACRSWDEIDGDPGAFPGAPSSLRSTARLSITIGLLWLFSQWIFNLSLLHTSVATNTVFSSTSSIFTFIFSLLICGDPFRWRSFAASLASFVGCALVALEPPPNLSKDAVATSTLGEVLALASAAMFALASVLLRRLAPEDLDTGCYMGMNGLVAICLSPALLYAAHSGGLESFRPPPASTLLFLALNAFLGCTFANYLYTCALLLLSPLVTSVCLSLSIPVSALFDEVLLRQHSFSGAWALGASLVAGGAALAAMDLEAVEAAPKDQHEEPSEELESLVGDAGGEEEEAKEEEDGWTWAEAPVELRRGGCAARHPQRDSGGEAAAAADGP